MFEAAARALSFSALCAVSAFGTPSASASQEVSRVEFEARATLLSPLEPRADGSLGAQADLLAALANERSVLLIENHVPGAPDLTFELARVRLPGTDGLVHVDGRAVSTIAEAGSPDLSVWKGRVAGQPASDVFLALSSAGTWGWLRLEDGRTVHLVCGSHPVDGWAQAQAQWIEEAALVRPGFEQRFACEQRDEQGRTIGADVTYPWPNAPHGSDVGSDGRGASQGDATGGTSSGAGSHVHGGRGGNGGGAAPLLAAVQQTVYRAEAVIETDYSYYQEFNNTTAATNYTNALLAACSDRYETQVGCEWTVSYLAFYSSSATDPFAGTSPSALLDEMKARWDGTGGQHTLGDFGLVLSSENGGGIAYVGTLCSDWSAVGACCSLNGNTPYPVTGTSSLNWDFVVTAHEVGHIFASPHTHAFCPPLDLCASNCNGTEQCSLGTIMSYCHTCTFQGIKNINPYFHQTCVDVMRGEVLSVSCLQVVAPPPPAPTVSSVAPSSVVAVPTDAWPTIAVNGNNFSSVTSVTVDGVLLSTLPAQYTIASNTRIDIPWSPKSKLGAVTIRLTNPGGSVETSVNVTANSSPTIDMVPSSPATWVQAAGLKVHLAGPTTKLFYLVASTSPLPSVVPGLVSLGLGNNLTNHVLLGVFGVDPLKGWTLVQIAPGSTQLPFGTQVLMQAVLVDTTNSVAPFPVTNLQSVTVLF
jgi:hypothetical protein